MDAPGFKEIEINERTRTILKYTGGRNASWKTENGGLWTTFYFQWAPGRTSAVLAHNHRPEFCLTSIGCQLQSKEPAETFWVHGFALPFRHFRFQQDGRPLYVWWCMWDEVEKTEEAEAGFSPYRGILRAVMRGRRNLGQQVLEIVLSGVEDSESAHAEMERMLPRLIVQNPGSADAGAPPRN